MIIIDPKVELLPISKSVTEMYGDIARAARVCYASESGKLETKVFLKNLYNRGHHRPFEFGTMYINPQVYTKLEKKPNNMDYQVLMLILHSPYTRVNNESSYCITTNCRVVLESIRDIYYGLGTDMSEERMRERIFESFLEFTSKYFKWTSKHACRFTFLWDISRVTADSFRTHVSLSSLMQSTRFCNYSKDKFNGQIRIARPTWMEHDSAFLNNAFTQQLSMMENIFMTQWKNAELYYNSATELGAPAQQARGMLPLDTATRFIQCGYEEHWENFFDQRVFDSTGPAHPDAKYIAEKALAELNEMRVKDSSSESK